MRQTQLSQGLPSQVFVPPEPAQGWVVWYGVVWCCVVWCGVVWCGVVWCGVLWWMNGVDEGGWVGKWGMGV